MQEADSAIPLTRRHCEVVDPVALLARGPMVSPSREAYELDLRRRSDGSPAAEAIIAVAFADLRDPKMKPYLHQLWRWWAHVLEVYIADPRESVGIGIVIREILASSVGPQGPADVP